MNHLDTTQNTIKPVSAGLDTSKSVLPRKSKKDVISEIKEKIIPKNLEDLDKFRGKNRILIKTINLFEDYHIFYGKKARVIHLKYFLCEPMQKPYEYASKMNIVFCDKVLKDRTSLKSLNFNSNDFLYALDKL